MITRLLARTQLCHPFRGLYCYSKFDDPKNKGSKSSFFGRSKDKADSSEGPNE